MFTRRFHSTAQIKGFPTIKMFPAGAKSASTVVEYDGPRDASGIAHWATDKLADNLPPPKMSEVCALERSSIPFRLRLT